MKILLFAHKPPPVHGQSVMVQRALEALGGDARRPPPAASRDAGGSRPIQCYHVDARLSEGIEDIGRARMMKFLRLLRCCLEAIWCRWRHGVTTLYYVPSPAVPASIMRDWIALGLCRPFFRTLVYHWHTTGLGAWMRTAARPWQRWVARRIMRAPDLSLVLRPHNLEDAEAFESRRVVVVPNGIPDPCPAYDREVRPARRLRAAVRRALLRGPPGSRTFGGLAGAEAAVFRVLFLSHCRRDKGLFDALEGVLRAGARHAGAPVRIEWVVAGDFMDPAERADFDRRVREAASVPGAPDIRRVGFAGEEQKRLLLATSDCLCLPTYYPAENFPVVLIEAMAFGLPVITTRWRGLDEVLPRGYPGLVDPRSPDQVAERILEWMEADADDTLRRHYEICYREAVFVREFTKALMTLAPAGEERLGLASLVPGP